jgi:hypothetical protein
LKALEAVESFRDSRKLWRRSKAAERSEALKEVEGSGGGRRLRRQQARSSGRGRKLWRGQEALERAGSPGGGRRLWRRSETLEEVEGSGGSTARSSGYGRKF